MVNKTDKLLASMRPQAQIVQPIATEMILPNHSGITGSVQAIAELDDRYVNTTGGDIMEASLRINGTVTPFAANKFLRVFGNGVELAWIGDYFGFTGFLNPTANSGTIFFGVANDTFTDLDSFVTCGPTSLSLIGPTQITFGTSIFNTEMTMTDNTLTFGNSGTIGWATSNQLEFNQTLSIETAGRGIDIKEGSNARMGTGQLSGGGATISTTAVTTNSRIFLTLTSQDNGGGRAFAPFVTNIVNGTSFDVMCDEGGGTTGSAQDNTFNWLIINPA